MSIEKEENILKPFYESAKKGEIIEVADINKAYQEKVDHKVGEKQIYRVLHRYGRRKIMPRSKHPKKTGGEAVEASKKLISM